MFCWPLVHVATLKGRSRSLTATQWSHTWKKYRDLPPDSFSRSSFGRNKSFYNEGGWFFRGWKLRKTTKDVPCRFIFLKMRNCARFFFLLYDMLPHFKTAHPVTWLLAVDQNGFSGPILIIRKQADWKRMFGTDIHLQLELNSLCQNFKQPVMKYTHVQFTQVQSGGSWVFPFSATLRFLSTTFIW